MSDMDESGPFCHKDRVPRVKLIQEEAREVAEKVKAGETLGDAMLYLATAFQTRNES
jgi:hypothetical protein